MTANQATIDFIRQVMADGVVTQQEVISLATYLNENRGARKSWPGSAVFEVLKDVFADGKIEAFEIEGLTKILQGIERICAGDTTGQTDLTRVEAAKESDTNDYAVQSLEQKVTVAATNQFDSTHVVDLRKHKCECKDWNQLRAKLPPKSPGRMCKHLVKGFELACAANPDFKKTCDSLFLALIKSSADTDRGLEAVENWKLLSKDGTDFLVAWGRKSDWCNVYAKNAAGKLERFGYQHASKRWSFGARPPKAGMLKEFLEKHF